MKKTILILSITLLSSTVFSQTDTINQYDKNGLKIGYWKLEKDFLDNAINYEEHDFYYEGYFKVINLDTTIDLNNVTSNASGIFSKSPKLGYYEPIFYYAGKTKNLISVPDGKWIESLNGSTGNEVTRIDYYKLGCQYRHEELPPPSYELFFRKATTEYYKDGTVTRDIEVDSLKLIFVRYINSYNKLTKIYYPDSKVQFDNAELNSEALFTEPDTLYISYTADDTARITSIKSSSDQLIVQSNDSKPIILLPGQKDSLQIVYAPDRNNIQERAIVTMKVNNDYLNFYFRLYAFDISHENINNVKSIRLKKTDSLELRFGRIYWHTYYALFKRPIKESQIKRVSRCKGTIRCGFNTDTGSTGNPNLSDLKVGTYYLTIWGDETIRNIEIVIEN